MRVTLITPEYRPSAGGGGIATHTAMVATQLQAIGHEVTVVARGDAPGVTSEQGVTVIRLRPWPIPNPTLAQLVHRFRAARAAQSTKADVLHAAEWGGEAVVATLLSKPLVTRLATPTYIVDELNGVRAGRDRLVRRLERLQAERSALVYGPTIAVSQRVAADWRVPVAPPIVNPVDVEEIRRSGTGEAGIELPAEFVAFIGRFERRKGIDVLGRALAEVLPDRPHLHAVLIGHDAGPSGGEVLRELRDVTRAVSDRIHVTGELARAQALAVVARAQVVVVPSRWESFGFTCVEAMALGLPVIASDAGGLAEIIEDGESGILVPPGDSAALVAALGALVDDPVRRAGLGQGGRRRSDRFDVVAVVPEIVTLLERAVAERHGSFDRGLYHAGYRQFFRPDSHRDPFHKLYAAKLELAVDELSRRPATRVLDLGGGFGRLTERVSDHHDVVLVDLSYDMLSEARRRGGSDAALVQADARRLPFRDGAFPILAMLDLATHVQDLDVLLPEVRRVVTPAGAVLFDTTNASPWWVLRYPSYVRWRPRRLVQTLRAAGVLPEWTTLVRHHHPREVQEAAARAGLTILGRRGIGPRPVPKWHLWQAERPSA